MHKVFTHRKIRYSQRSSTDPSLNNYFRKQKNYSGKRGLAYNAEIIMQRPSDYGTVSKCRERQDSGRYFDSSTGPPEKSRATTLCSQCFYFFVKVIRIPLRLAMFKIGKQNRTTIKLSEIKWIWQRLLNIFALNKFSHRNRTGLYV